MTPPTPISHLKNMDMNDNNSPLGRNNKANNHFECESNYIEDYFEDNQS